MDERRKTRAGILTVVSLASFMVALDALVVNTALDAIRREFALPLEALEWTVNAYNFSFAALLLTGAALGDRFGRRRVFVIGLVLFAAASVSCGISGGAAFLVAARAAQGAGAALVMPQAMAILSAAFPREARAKALGMFSGITGLALIAGPVAGGAVAEWLDWRWIFWINLPIALAPIAFAPRFIGESFGARAALDLRGMVLAAAAAFVLVWVVMRGNRAGWTSSEIVAGFGVFALLATGFLVAERRAGAPMVPPHLFRSRALRAGLAASFLLYAALYSGLFLLPQFLASVLGLGTFAAGAQLLPWTATMLVFSPLGGTFVERFGERSLVVAGLLMQAIGFAALGWIAAPDVGFIPLAGLLIGAGSGASLAMPAVQNAVLGAVAPAEIGKASGIFNTARFLGGVFGIAAVVAVFGAAGSVGSAENFNFGFKAAIALAGSLSFVGAIIALRLPQRRPMPAAAAKARV